MISAAAILFHRAAALSESENYRALEGVGRAGQADLRATGHRLGVAGARKSPAPSWARRRPTQIEETSQAGDVSLAPDLLEKD